MDLVPLVQALTRRGVPLVLHLIGAGEDGRRLREEFTRSGLDRQVRSWGWLTPGDVSDRLRQLDVVLLLSDSEGLPFVLLEAMAHGVVPVATRIASGNVELLRDGENGLLVAVGDPVGAADCVEKLYLNPELRAELRRAAWRTVERYSVERMTTKYEACLAHGGDRAPRPVGPFPVMPSCRSAYPHWLRKLKWHLSAIAVQARRR
jgi:glycosyltransferase involved in cell wall biosynthesis